MTTEKDTRLRKETFGVSVFRYLLMFVVVVFLLPASPNCDPRCKGAQGICQADGRCFCWWGWTGPNATYITSGADKNRIRVREYGTIQLLQNYYASCSTST